MSIDLLISMLNTYCMPEFLGQVIKMKDTDFAAYFMELLDWGLKGMAG
jgi:hypothetical protein